MLCREWPPCRVTACLCGEGQSYPPRHWFACSWRTHPLLCWYEGSLTLTPAWILLTVLTDLVNELRRAQFTYFSHLQMGTVVKTDLTELLRGLHSMGPCMHTCAGHVAQGCISRKNMESRELPETSSERKRELQESSREHFLFPWLPCSHEISVSGSHVGCDLGAESYLSQELTRSAHSSVLLTTYFVGMCLFLLAML